MSPTKLRRDIGTFGAAMLGLGAMIGTGVFVSIGLGAGIAGPAVLLALGATAVLTLVVLAGIRRSNAANVVIVSITLLSLAFFVLAGIPHVRAENLTPFFGEPNAETYGFGPWPARRRIGP